MGSSRDCIEIQGTWLQSQPYEKENRVHSLAYKTYVLQVPPWHDTADQEP